MLFSFHCYGKCLGVASIDRSYTFSIVPQLPAAAIYNAWEPILQKIGRELGICFLLNVPSSIPVFEDDLKAGKPDFAYMNPYHLFLLKGVQGYIPILADSKHKLYGFLVIKRDSSISKIEDLNGQKIAFPAPNSLAASLLIRAYLNANNINYVPEYVKTHSNVYRSVIVGDVIAGGGINNTLMREPLQLKKELKILVETPKYTPHPIAVNPRVSLQIRKEVSEYFIELSRDPRNASMFEAIQIPKPIEVNFKDYEYIKRLRINSLAENSGG
jgi:phosphonate transport system substrate-binding protein